MGDAAGEHDGGVVPARWTGAARGRSVRTLLVLLVLLPIIGMLVVSLVSTRRLERERRDATALEHRTDRLVGLVEARTAISGEEVASSVLVIGADLGVDAAGLEELFGQDFAAALDAARVRLDDDPTLAVLPEVAAGLTELRALRPLIDAGTLSFPDLVTVTTALTDEIDAVWDARVREQITDVLGSELPASVQVRFQALTAMYIALSAAADRALLTEIVLTGDPTDAQLLALVEATGAYRAAVRVLPDRLGPLGTAAWQAHTDQAAGRRFEAVLDDTIVAVAGGVVPPLASDPVAFGTAYIDGPAWARGISTAIRATAADLRDLTRDHAADATRAVVLQALVVVLLALASLATALWAARSLATPITHLEDAAHQIHDGRFDLPPLPERGPRELADMARAFNEMSSTLAAVERHAVALADDTDAPVLQEPLPGRTGRALQVALGRVRSSMQVAEQHRRELERTATHDGLTGLLNRAAAFEVVARDLLRADRGGGRVVALYLDLDDLKPINDAHSHAAGDDALRLTADALRGATRASDVVARLGGDEFLVAGVLSEDGDDEAEAEELAERVRTAVSSRSVERAEGDIPLGCSIGIAVAGRGTSAEVLIDEADRALLEAKRGGKDRISWWSGRAQPPRP